MKKFLLALTLISLLAACENTQSVEEETPPEESSAKVMAPQPFYIKNLYEEDGQHMIDRLTVAWLSESDGTCENEADSKDNSSLSTCNPNGFLIIEGDSELIHDLPKETRIYVNNLGSILGLDAAEADEEGNYEITFEVLMMAFQDEPEFFEVTPFELGYGTMMVDGVERPDAITVLKEIYIP